MIGIYGIHNKVNGRWYVGQSQNIEKRNATERRYLSKGRFHWGTGDNKHLARAWQKYGADAFEWVVLEECPLEKLDEREIYWIDQKDSYHNGYNLTQGGGGLRGYKVSEATRRKISEHHADVSGPRNPMYGKMKSGPEAIHYGRKHSEEARKKMINNHADINGSNNPRATAVDQFDEVGQHLRRWACIQDAERATGVNHRNISAVCQGKRQRAGGYKWRYAK